ncbi:MFS transporter [Conexivisphaera calida]|uniref:Transport protein n=1 Tax=Conexivisphaera calida TaxID=1874277 RepID=A0A4P2VDX0_9ARCH|nr:MFS transporter [Conexivisphaera calida]BBE42826.1 Transport protein [Conexivisphaera calida]
MRAVAGLSGTQWRIVLAAWMGWLLDGYVSIAYALAASIISPLFFPELSPLAGLIATYMGFAVNGVARPLGSALFGNYLGDRLGRRTMLVVTVMGFSILGASISLLPTYAQAGLLAPILLFAALFAEGLFAGAEYGGGAALSMESVPPGRRGIVGSFVQSGFGTGYFVVALAFSALSVHFGPLMSTVGWRVLFATSIVPGLVALAMRYTVPESPVFEDMRRAGQVERVPLGRLIRESWRDLSAALMITTGLLAVNGITFSLYPTILTRYAGVGEAEMGLMVALVNLISLVGVWSGGAVLSYVVWRRRLAILAYAIAFAAIIYPTSMAVLSGGRVGALAGAGAQALIEAMIFAPLPAFLSEVFSKRYRASGAGVAYNGGLIVGSFAIPITLAISGYIGFPAAWILTMFAWTALVIAGAVLSRETWSSEGEDSALR